MAIGSWSRKEKAGEHNAQIELTDASLPLKDVLVRFKIQLQKSRTHFNESEWLRNAQKVNKVTLTRNESLMFTDFSATCDLHAAKLDNCSQDTHAVLSMFVLRHSSRFVTVQQEDGEDVGHQINDCDVWHFFGDTISKGKKNDHIFHNACLKEIVESCKRQFQRDGRVLNQAKRGLTIAQASASASAIRIFSKLGLSQTKSAASSSFIALHKSAISKEFWMLQARS
jgi:hypothetical protein